MTATRQHRTATVWDGQNRFQRGVHQHWSVLFGIEPLLVPPVEQEDRRFNRGEGFGARGVPSPTPRPRPIVTPRPSPAPTPT